MLQDRTKPAFCSAATIVSHSDACPRSARDDGDTTRRSTPASFAQVVILATALSVDASSTSSTLPGRGLAFQSEARQLITSSAWLKLGTTTAHVDGWCTLYITPPKAASIAVNPRDFSATNAHTAPLTHQRLPCAFVDPAARTVDRGRASGSRCGSATAVNRFGAGNSQRQADQPV